MNDYDLLRKYVDESKWKKSFKLLNQGYPVQYIIGNVEFINNIIFVNKNVLIPRFETEYLVEKTLKYIKKYNINNPKILDLCTGSGCIAISIASELNTTVDALDISKKALRLAKKNALHNKVNVNFFKSDLEKFVPNKKYDVIISNPPYVSFNEDVDPKTYYEPSLALYAIDNGLYYYKAIFNRYKKYLSDKYILAFEIGETEGISLLDYAKVSFPKANIWIEKDLNNKDRYLFITNFE